MRTFRTLSRRAAAVALAGTLAFGVAACSSDDTTDDGAATDVATDDSMLEEPASTDG
ncbi:MAG TPA: hypothetical protein VJ978_00935 [Nitriliruptoraceae bacterium]|nr:hypothetical protein [Nitriliruptoraceae bacterium]